MRELLRRWLDDRLADDAWQVVSQGLFGHETDWLQEEGWVNIRPDNTDELLARMDPGYAQVRKRVKNSVCIAALTSSGEHLENLIRSTADAAARSAAIAELHRGDSRVTPIVFQSTRTTVSQTSLAGEPMARSDAMRVIFRSLPIPDENIPWEAIRDYREDPEARRALTALRHWLNEVLRSGRSERELVDLMAYELDRYEQGLRRHRLKCRLGFLEATFTTPVEMFENVLKLRFTNAVRGVFSLGRMALERLESEASLPGRELHYLVKTREEFT